MGADNSASIFTGRNPFLYAPNTPLPLFIIQALIVILMCRTIHMALRPFRQPRVIAEVIAGIILGPSVLGHIPGYLNAVFPKESLVFLQLVAELGLVFFLFLVGLELDLRTLRHNARVAVVISVAGIAVPMATSVVAAYAVYTTLTDQTQSFPTFVLFMAVAMSITAFPVLARILSELKLLQTHVGGITISAAAFDDATAWCLLALVMSILHAKDNLTVLWILLTGIAYSCFLYFVVGPLFARLERRNRTEHGPSQLLVLVTIMLVLTSAFITDALGIHAIFGAFLIGVILPNDGGFAIGITEKIEDFVNLLFLPLYFTLSGLRTNISLLSDGITWAMLFLVVFVAFFGKLLGCVSVARYYKMTWRESGAIGVLMSCKGLVELIVLNLGLDAGIINERVFVVMVMMAIVTTFLTVPLSSRIYPEQYHKKMIRKNSEDDAVAEDTEEASSPKDSKRDTSILPWDKSRLRVLVALTGMQQVPALMTLVQLLKRRGSSHSPGDAYPRESEDFTRLDVFALRLIELSDRTSTVMMASDSTLLHTQDSILNVFRTFSQLAGVAIRSQAVVAPKGQFPSEVCNQAKCEPADLILVPWQTDDGNRYRDREGDNPLAHLFVQKNGSDRHYYHSSPAHAAYISAVFETSVGIVAVLVDHGFAGAKGIRKVIGHQNDMVKDQSNASRDDLLAPPAGAASNSTLTEKVTVEAKPSPATLSPVKATFEIPAAQIASGASPVGNHNTTTHHPDGSNNISQIFVPFFGGPDDRAALKLAVTLSTGGFGLGVSVLRTITADSDEGSGIGSSSIDITPSTEHHRNDQEESDLRLLQTLFPSLVDSPNATTATAGFHSYATVDAETQRSVAKEFALLNKRHLAVVGRRRNGPRADIGDAKDLDVGEVSVDERSALGSLAAELLAICRRASVLVVQAGTEKSG